MDAGYVMYRHGKCMILLKKSTAMRNVRPVAGQPKDTMVWRSASHNTMAVTLDTPDGALVVICAYVPPGVDALPQSSDKGPSIDSVTDQHDEAAALVRNHAHAIMVMDGNETENEHGRVQVRRNGTIVLSGNHRNSGISTMTMASLARAGMADSHRHLHATRDGHSEYPRRQDLTHEKPGPNGMLVESKLDYSLSSRSAIARLTGCTLDHRPKHWAKDGKERKSYHKMLITT
jgi:exonuclease III